MSVLTFIKGVYYDELRMFSRIIGKFREDGSATDGQVKKPVVANVRSSHTYMRTLCIRTLTSASIYSSVCIHTAHVSIETHW